MFLHIRNVGGSRIQGASEQIELQGLFSNIVGLQTSVRAGLGAGGGLLPLEQALDLLYRLPWLGSLLSSGGAGGLRL